MTVGASRMRSVFMTASRPLLTAGSPWAGASFSAPPHGAQGASRSGLVRHLQCRNGSVGAQPWVDSTVARPRAVGGMDGRRAGGLRWHMGEGGRRGRTVICAGRRGESLLRVRGGPGPAGVLGAMGARTDAVRSGSGAPAAKHVGRNGGDERRLEAEVGRAALATAREGGALMHDARG